MSNYLIVTFAFITGVQVVACATLKYKTATFEYWIILILFIFVAVIADIAGWKFANGVSIKGEYLKKQHKSIWMERNNLKFDFLCMICVIYTLGKFFVLSGSLPNTYYIVQEEFQNQYAGGFNFYVRLLMMIATVYYWGCSKVSKRNMIMGFLCLLPNILTFVKGIVFIPCLASILLRLKRGELRISPKTGIIIFTVGIGVFFGVYLIEMGIYKPEIVFDIDTYKFIISKLVDYLVAGVQSFSQNISNNNGESFRTIDNVTLAPFINTFAKLGFGESIDTLSPIFQNFGYSSIRNIAVTSNVNTYIGSLFLYNGFLLGNLLNIFWVFITSFMDEIFDKNFDILTALSALFCAAFALGWFEYYFMHTFWIYLIIIAFITSLFIKTKIAVKT